jgi:hypothetical protein
MIIAPPKARPDNVAKHDFFIFASLKNLRPIQNQPLLSWEQGACHENNVRALNKAQLSCRGADRTSQS